MFGFISPIKLKTRAALATGLFLLGACASMSTTNVPRLNNIYEFMDVKSRPKICAHRGFSGVAPENTLAAFQRAIDSGADMFELDVLMTKDGEIVCIHDETVDRTTNGKGKVSELTLAEIKRLDAGSWYAPEFAGEKIPTLAEALDLAKDKIFVNIEIKGEAVTDQIEGGIEEKILRLVSERGMTHQVMITSFDPRAIRHMRDLDINIQTAMLYNEKLQANVPPMRILIDTGANGFNLSKSQVTKEIVDECNNAGRPVAVYTVNDWKEMRTLIEMGVDVIITDRPDVAMRLVR